MKRKEAELVFDKLLYSFNSNLEEKQMLQWYEYLAGQDFGVAQTVARWFQMHSDRAFMPTISEFHAKVKTQQMEVSRREMARRDMAACIECSGLTWLDDPTGVLPCPQCRPTTLKNFENGDYEPGVPPNPDELDGPKDTYTMAAEPRLSTGPAVSPERARQWQQHLLSLSPSIYPEGDTLVTEEESNGF